ncbi:MAG: pilus assembly protein TadG-related protein [Pirellulales bacterium]
MPRQLHNDERGTISIVSVFAFLLLAMLLGMVMNVGRQVDNKVRMQNAADAAAYSGSIVVARGMNDLAFTNHLLADVFALTAFMREARDRHSEQLTPEILAKWDEVAPTFQSAQFQRFSDLGRAIPNKTRQEREMVLAYSEWAAATSEVVLPTMEEILANELIPQYQRALVAATPQLAQLAADETARRHSLRRDGQIVPDRGPMHAFLWRTNGAAVGGEQEQFNPTLPVVDPAFETSADADDFRQTARQQRQSLARTYLNQRNNEAITAFRSLGKMSQFAVLWDGFTKGQLEQLLDEYPDSNLPHVIRRDGREFAGAGSSQRNRMLEELMLVAVVYWKPAESFAPGVFRSPIEGDYVTFAQAQTFIPAAKLIRVFEGRGGGGGAPSGIPIGGVPGEYVELPPQADPPAQNPMETPPTDDGELEWTVVRESVPTSWDILNQRWNARLVPATAPGLLAILQSEPPYFALGDPVDVQLPDLGDISDDDLNYLNHH